MATEAPLLHHSQCTAGEDLSATGARAGFNGTGQFLVMSLTAARSVVRPASATVLQVGILQNDPISGFVADIGFLGVSKVILGTVTSIVFGSPLMAMADGSGRVILGVTFVSNFAVGYVIDIAGSPAINQVITAMVFPAVLD